MEELGIEIVQLVESQLPAGFSVSEDYVKQRTRVWQLFLHGEAGVDETDMFDITKYPAKYQIIIGYLIMWDIIQKILLGSFIKVSGGDGTTPQKGVVKKITTGPSDVEFHNSSEALAGIIKALHGDLTQAFIGTACAFASSMGLQLPFCDKIQGFAGPTIMKNCNSPTVNHKCINNGCLCRPKSVG
jgi:hypothetical protein